MHPVLIISLIKRHTKNPNTHSFSHLNPKSLSSFWTFWKHQTVSVLTISAVFLAYFYYYWITCARVCVCVCVLKCLIQLSLNQISQHQHLFCSKNRETREQRSRDHLWNRSCFIIWHETHTQTLSVCHQQAPGFFSSRWPILFLFLPIMHLSLPKSPYFLPHAG